MAEMDLAPLGSGGDSPCHPVASRFVQGCFFHLTTLLRRIPGGLQLTLDVVCLFWNATLQHREETLNMEKAKFQ